MSLVSCSFPKLLASLKCCSLLAYIQLNKTCAVFSILFWLSGVLHGNVNPDTVWFSGSTDKCVQVKLAGFDESQYVDNAHHRMARTTNQVQYRAREVFLKSYLPSVDAWALGAVLYEAVAGQAAYQGTCKLSLYRCAFLC